MTEQNNLEQGGASGKRLAKASQKREFHGIQVITGNKLLAKEFPPPEYLADGLIATGTTLLCGDPKVGKSRFAQQLILCVAGGQDMLGKYPAQVRGKVLYFCLEDGERRLNRRMKAFGFDTATAANLLVAHEAPKIGEGFEEELERLLVADPEVRLVIIDPVVQLRPVSGGNNPFREDYAAIQNIRTVLEKYGVSGVLVLHLRKEQGGGDPSPLAKISGTQGLAGAADHILILAGVRGKKAATLHRISRDDEELEVGLEQDGIRWAFAGDAKSVTLSHALRPLYECVAASPEPIGPTDIAKAVGKSKGTVGEQCKDLVKIGVLDEFDGKYGRAS